MKHSAALPIRLRLCDMTNQRCVLSRKTSALLGTQPDVFGGSVNVFENKRHCGPHGHRDTDVQRVGGFPSKLCGGVSAFEETAPRRGRWWCRFQCVDSLWPRTLCVTGTATQTTFRGLGLFPRQRLACEHPTLALERVSTSTRGNEGIRFMPSIPLTKKTRMVERLLQMQSPQSRSEMSTSNLL